MQKLDAERQRASRLEHELSHYREGKSLADRLAEKDDIINGQKRMIDKLNAQLDWLKRKVLGQSRPSSYDPVQLTFDFGEMSVSPEEEEAYRKSHEELDAYHQQRKDAAEKRMFENRPSRRPIPEGIRRERIDIYPEGYNEEEWELLSDKLCERKVVLHRKPAEYVAIECILHKAVRKDDIERTIRCATAPKIPIAKSYAWSNALANLMVGKYVDGFPFYRQI